jgi:hypothetical protein
MKTYTDGNGVDEGKVVEIEELPSGTFKESGTNVATVMVVMKK